MEIPNEIRERYQGLFRGGIKSVQFDVDQMCVFLVCVHCGDPLVAHKDPDDEGLIYIEKCQCGEV